MSKKPGRPTGSPNVDATAQASPSRCPACDSTDRGPYMGSPNVQEFGGVKDGQPYTHIVRRRCQCTACWQIRIDVSYENRTAKK
jgi:hypothetical protein